MTAASRVLERLERVHRSGAGWTARCPAHEDRQPSLSIAEGEDGRVLLNCHAGCTLEQILGALELTTADLFEDDGTEERTVSHEQRARFRISEEDIRGWQQALLNNARLLGRLATLRGWTREAVEQLELGFDRKRITIPVRDGANRLVGLVRYAPNPETRNGEPKAKADPGSRRDLFPGPETIPDEERVFLFEGEPDVIAAVSIGLPAVAVPGVKGWRSSWRRRFAGRRVIVVFDCDAEGREAAQRIAADLAGVASEVRVLDLAPHRDDGYDLTDWLSGARLPNAHPEAKRLLEELAAEAPLCERSTDADGVRAIPASTVRRERVDWLWPGRIALGSVTLLAGDPGLGKSMLACHLAASLSRGELNGSAGVALISTAEDSLSATIKPRLEAVEADLAAVRFVVLRRDGIDETVILPNNLRELDRLVVETKAKLVVVDPLMAHLEATVNSWRDQSVRQALAPLHRLADDRGCAVLVVAHLNKAKGLDPLARIGGSIGIPAATRSVLLLARDPDDPDGEQGRRRVLAQLKSNVGPLAPGLVYEVEPVVVPAMNGEPEVETAKMSLIGESERSGRELLTAIAGDERSDLEEATDFLRGELAGGPVEAKKVMREATDTGVSVRTLERAKRKLGVQSRKDGFGGGWKWSLPTDSEGPAEDRQGGWRPSEDDLFGDLRENPHEQGDSAPLNGHENIEGRHRGDMAAFGPETASEHATSIFDELLGNAGEP